MSGLSLDDARDAKDDATQGRLRENDAGISEENQIDYEESSSTEVRLHADSLVAFDHIARIQINHFGYLEEDEGLLDQEQNLENGGPYGYQLQLTLANPEIIEGELWVDDPDAQYPDYKVISDPEAENNPYELREDIIKDDDGTPTGTELLGIGNLGGSSWDGQRVEDGQFPTEYITVPVRADRAVDVLGALDTAGRWYFDKEGNAVEGLFEVPPGFFEDYSGDLRPRLVGYPELRADMDGHRGAISAMFDGDPDGNTPVDVDIYKVTEDGSLEALIPLSPDDEAYALPTYPRGGKMYWDHDEDHPEPDVGADAEPQSADGFADAQAEMSDEVTYDSLGEDTQEFVDEAAEALEGADVGDIDDLGEHTLEERVATADVDLSAGSVSDLRSIINERA